MRFLDRSQALQPADILSQRAQTHSFVRPRSMSRGHGRRRPRSMGGGPHSAKRIVASPLAERHSANVESGGGHWPRLRVRGRRGALAFFLSFSFFLFASRNDIFLCLDHRHLCLPPTGAVLGSLPASASLPAADFPKRPMTGPGFSASAPVGGSFLTGVAPDEEEEDTAAIPHRISKGIASPEQRRVHATPSTLTARDEQHHCGKQAASAHRWRDALFVAAGRLVVRHCSRAQATLELTLPLDAAAVVAAAPPSRSGSRGCGRAARAACLASTDGGQGAAAAAGAGEAACAGTHALAKTAYRDARRSAGTTAAPRRSTPHLGQRQMRRAAPAIVLPAKLQSHERALNDARRAAILNPCRPTLRARPPAARAEPARLRRRLPVGDAPRQPITARRRQRERASRRRATRSASRRRRQPRCCLPRQCGASASTAPSRAPDDRLYDSGAAACRQRHL